MIFVCQRTVTVSHFSVLDSLEDAKLSQIEQRSRHQYLSKWGLVMRREKLLQTPVCSVMIEIPCRNVGLSFTGSPLSKMRKARAPANQHYRCPCNSQEYANSPFELLQTCSEDSHQREDQVSIS